MREKDKLATVTIRGVLAAIQYEEMRKESADLSEEETIAVLKNEVKKRAEALEYAEQGNRSDLREQLLRERAVIEEFLPRQMSPEELKSAVSHIIAQAPGSDLGRVMKQLKEEYAGLYDGRLASQIAKEALSR